MDSELQIRVVPAIAEVPAAAWDACADPESASEDCPYNPFVSHAFLHALEASGLGHRTHRLAAAAPRRRIGECVVGVVPCYLKSHSRGEYVFDAGWAEAYERAGGSYYPKLQVSVPFTPATGQRLLVRPGETADLIREALAKGLVELCRMREASSVHVTFAPESEWQLLGAHGFLKRNDQQFHWENGGYATFDDFLWRARGAQAKADPARAQRRAGKTASRCSGSPAAT
jgi:predicted N-acyltransferase